MEEHDFKVTGYINPFVEGCKCKICTNYFEAVEAASEALARQIDNEIMESIKNKEEK